MTDQSHSLCSSMGHEEEPATGEAWIVDDDGNESPHPYCTMCLDLLQRTGERIRRWSAM